MWAGCERDTVQEVVDAIIGRNENGPDVGAQHAAPYTSRFRVVSVATIGSSSGLEVAASCARPVSWRAQIDGETVRLDQEGAEQRVRAGKDVLVLVDRIDATRRIGLDWPMQSPRRSARVKALRSP